MFSTNLSLLSSATAAFTSADLGQPLKGYGGSIVPGTVISQVISATLVELSIPAVTNFSAQTINFGPVIN